ETAVALKNKTAEEEEKISGLLAEKNIGNTPHDYQLVQEPEDIRALTDKLLLQQVISFDTETTGIDDNNADLVGVSFSYIPGTGYYIPLPAEREQVLERLRLLQPLFDNAAIQWVGQNIKYDLLVLKWYG